MARLTNPSLGNKAVGPSLCDLPFPLTLAEAQLRTYKQEVGGSIP